MMMIFTSIYGVVDGFFVSNFAGKIPFAAVTFIMPFIMILGAIGLMFGTGGSAMVSKTMGEGEPEKAKRFFSMIVYVSFLCGALIAIFGAVLMRPIAIWLGAEGEMLENCVLYGRILMISMPLFVLQTEFQSFFITAERPQLGLFVTVGAGVTNIVLDALFVAVFQWGLVGAAAATAISECIGGVIPIIYFSRSNSSTLCLTGTGFDGQALLKVCTNGSSELMSNVSMSLVGMMYNMQLMRYAGENGVAAYGVLMYVNFIFISAFIGYSIGTAPVVGYHYGAENHGELKSLLRKSFVIIGCFAIGMFAAAELLARPLAQIFVGYDDQLLELTLRGFFIFSFAFLFSGFSIFGSAFFTALNNGLISACISFLRTLVFQMAAVIVFPLFWDIDGIWISIVAAEMMAAAVTLLFLFGMRSRYHY